MLTSNISVREGKANGTQATVLRVVLREGVTPSFVNIAGDVQVPAVIASDVAHVVLQHSNSRAKPTIFN